MTVRLKVQYGTHAPNDLFTGNAKTEAELLRVGWADKNIGAGVTHVPPAAEPRWQTPVSLKVNAGAKRLFADNSELPGRSHAAETVVGDTPMSPEAAYDVLLALTGEQVPQPPTRVAPFQAVNGTVYVDPSRTGDGDGSFANPYKNPPTYPYAGSQTLLKAGTTYSPADGFWDIRLELAAVGATAGVGQPKTIFGVYDPVTGSRISGRGAGLAKVMGNGAHQFAIRADHANSRWNLCFDGLEAAGSNSASGDGMIKLQSVGNSQLLNCKVQGTATKGIFANGTTAANAYEGNVMLECLEGGIVENVVNGTVVSSTFQHNNTCSINVYSAQAYNGLIASNKVEGVTARTTNGITLDTCGGAADIHSNFIRRCALGVSVIGSVGDAISNVFTNTKVRHNDIAYCQFGIYLRNLIGTVSEFNRIDWSGTYDGLTAFNPANNFGRAIETYGLTSAGGPRNCVIRYNILTNTFSLNPDGSEGCALGLDEHTWDTEAYSNYVYKSWGNGVQSNRTIRCKVYGNFIVRPQCAPAGAYPDNLPSGGGRGDGGIVFAASPGWEAVNNTVILDANDPYALFGVTESHYLNEGGTKDALVANNLIIGAKVCGLVLNTVPGRTTEQNNIVEDSPALAREPAAFAQGGLGAPKPAGPNSFIFPPGKTGVTKSLLAPIKGGVCDGTGAPLNPAVRSLSGRAFGFAPPVGALQAA